MFTMHKSSDEEIKNFLQKNSLFSGLSTNQLNQLACLVKKININQGDIIIRENEISDEIYLIQKGEVEVTKYDEATAQSHRIASLGEGAVIGEISLLDNAPRSATVTATQASMLIAISINNLQALATEESVYNKIAERLTTIANEMRQIKVEPPPYLTIIKNLAGNIGQRVRTTNNSVIEGLRRELAEAKARAALGRLIVFTIAMLAFYIVVLHSLDIFHPTVVSSTVISVPLIAVFASGCVLLMKQSGYPMSLFGFTTKNWRRATIESLLFTIPFLIVISLYKWALVHFDPSFAGKPVFEVFGTIKNLPFLQACSLFLAYLIFVPLQELITRGTLQSSMQELLTGRYKMIQAIVLSNLLFGIVHFHLSMSLGAAVGATGLIWGWMYARQGTLIGVTISHLIAGAWALFIVGFE